MKNKLFIISLVILLGAAFGAPSIAKPHLNQAPSELKLGGLFPLSGKLAGGGVEREAAFRMAINEINLDSNILPDTTLLYAVRDTETTPDIGASAAQELIDLGVFGLVGAASSSVSKAIAKKAEAAQLPQISYSSTNKDLSDKTQYPYFLRVVPPDSMQGAALANILKGYGVTQVATLASSDDYGKGGIEDFEAGAATAGITIVTSQKFDQGAADVKTQLQAIKDSGVKHIVLNVIVGDAKTVFSQAKTVGISAADGYNWIGTDGPTQDQVYEGSADIKAGMMGMVGTAPNRGSGEKYKHFLDIWQCGNDKDFSGSGDRQPNTYASFAYDAVYAFALAADKMIKAGDDPTDGAKLLTTLKALSFTGATGNVKFDENGDRPGIYDLLNLQDDGFKIVGSYDLVDGLTQFEDVTWGNTTVTKGDGTGAPDYSNDALDCSKDLNSDIYKVGQDSEEKESPGFGLLLALFASVTSVVVIRRKRKN